MFFSLPDADPLSMKARKSVVNPLAGSYEDEKELIINDGIEYGDTAYKQHLCTCKIEHNDAKAQLEHMLLPQNTCYN